MKFLRENWGKFLLAVFFLVTPVFHLYADTNIKICDPEGGKICNPLSGSSNIQDFIVKVLQGALKIGIPLIALAIIYCGFLFVKARGNPEELTKAKDALLYTLIGAAVLLGAMAIATLISDTVFSLGK